jgi:hypothetical protein
MRTTAKNPDITPIPVQLAETEFNEFTERCIQNLNF